MVHFKFALKWAVQIWDRLHHFRAMIVHYVMHDSDFVFYFFIALQLCKKRQYFAIGRLFSFLKCMLWRMFLCSSHCLRVMSSPEAFKHNSMQYSTLWMCLQWVCWIILLNKCVLRENSNNMVHDRGREYYPADSHGSMFITTLYQRWAVTSNALL